MSSLLDKIYITNRGDSIKSGVKKPCKPEQRLLVEGSRDSSNHSKIMGLANRPAF